LGFLQRCGFPAFLQGGFLWCGSAASQCVEPLKPALPADSCSTVVWCWGWLPPGGSSLQVDVALAEDEMWRLLLPFAAVFGLAVVIGEQQQSWQQGVAPGVAAAVSRGSRGWHLGRQQQGA
jgi:hypothetical protein